MSPAPASRTRRPALIGASVVAFALAGGGLWLANSPAQLLTIAVSRERGAAGLEQLTTRVDDHEIVYLAGGATEGETVLLLHGFAADKDNWTRFGKTVEAEGFQILAPDLPGHGESSRLPNHTYDIPSQVEFVERFLDQRGLAQVHVVGNSMGGHIAAGFAALHPERVLTLGLFNSGGVTAPELSERRRITAETGENPLLVENVEDFDRFLKFAFVVPPPMPKVVKQYFADRSVLNRPFNEKIYADLSAGRRLPLEPLLSRIDAPTLILWGDSDRILHPSGATVFEAGLRRSETVILDHCGHSPMIERPEETANAWVAFVRRAAS